MSVTGDFGGLDAAIRDVTACETIPRRAVGAIASELSSIVRESFDGARTPEGVPWRRLRDARGRPLVRTGKLRAGATRPLFFGLSIRFALPTYGDLQQGGTRTIPARAFLPGTPLDGAVEARLLRAVAGATR